MTDGRIKTERTDGAVELNAMTDVTIVLAMTLRPSDHAIRNVWGVVSMLEEERITQQGAQGATKRATGMNTSLGLAVRATCPTSRVTSSARLGRWLSFARSVKHDGKQILGEGRPRELAPPEGLAEDDTRRAAAARG